MTGVTRFVAIAVALLLVLVTILVGLLALFQERMIFPAPSGPVPTAVAELSLETIETPDGERLAALWHEAEDGEATVLFLHGNATAIAHLRQVASAWTDLGYGFLAPAWRGYPGSTGASSESGILTDSVAAHDWLVERTAGPIAVYGQSLGSGPAVHLAAERDPVALILEAPYDSVLAVASARFPFLPVEALLRHSFRSDLKIASVDAPVLIVHGTADGVIPSLHGRALHASAPEGTRMHEVEGATHFNIGALAWSRITAFVGEAVSNRATNG